MTDGQRIYPVNLFVIHHSAGPDFRGASDLEVQDWFDAIGKDRGYAGLAHSYHLHPQRDKETFAQAQIALVQGADGTWRIVPLMQDGWDNVAWHCGDWEKNQRSIGCEVCGNYSEKTLPNEALLVLADFWREQDQMLNGATELSAHKWIYATACPGLIEGQIVDPLVNMVNDPTPYIETWDEVKIPVSIRFTMNSEIPLFNFETGKVLDSVGGIIDVAAKTNIYKGTTWYLSQNSVTENIPVGYAEQDLYGNGYAVSPIPLPDPGPDPEPEPTPPGTETLWDVLVKWWQWWVEWLKSWSRPT